MPIGIDPRYEGEAPGLATQPVYAPRQEESPKPSLLDTAAAASRQGHLAGALYERITNSDPDIQTPANYDPLDDIAGFEPYAKEFVSADSKGEVQGIKNRITSRIADQRVLQRAGLTGTAAELGMTFTDPTFLASALVPELGMARLGRLRRPLQSAIEGAVGASGYEAAMQSVQTGRSGYESALNIGGGAILGGTFGTLLHRVPASESASLKTALDDSITNPVRSEVGAAASHATTTMEQEEVAAGTKQLMAVTGKVPFTRTDMQLIFDSKSLRARQILQDLAEVPVPLAKNEEGIATGVDSVESRVISSDSELANFADAINSGFDSFRQRAGSGMSRTEFEEAVAGAARRGDTSPIPEVDALAKHMRERIFDPKKEEAVKLGILDDPVKSAIEREERRAVDQYVNAESKQIYADYRARTLQAINEAQPEQILKGTSGLTGDALSAGSRAAQIRTDLELALETERGISARNLSDIDTKVYKAQQAFDKELTTLRTQQELNAEALRNQNVVAQDATRSQTKQSREHLLDRLALSLSTERQILGISIDKIEAEFEGATRKHQRDLSRISQLDRGQRRLERARARIDLERASKQRAVEIQKARAEFNTRRGELLTQHGKDAIKAASKVAREHPSLREAYQYGRDTERTRSKLNIARMAAQAERKAERVRAQKAQGDIKLRASKDLEKLAPASRKRFMKRAERVLRGEVDDSPEVNRLAKLLKDRDIGTLKSRVKPRSVDIERVKKPLGAESYVRRMYDREKIRAARSEWDTRLVKHFMKSGVERSEAVAAADDITRKILGADVGQANFGMKVSVAEAGPLKERSLDIPDAQIEPFLVNEPMKIARAYIKELTPQIEIVKRFGDRDMKPTLEEVAHEYDVLKEQSRQKIKDDPEKLSQTLSSLEQEAKLTIEALIRVRDRVIGKTGRLSPQAGEGTRKMVQAVRHWRNLVLSSKLGMAALVSVPQDMARVAAQYGFLPTMKNLTKLVTSPEFRSLSKVQARKAGAAVEVALSRRVQDAFDGAYSEGWSQTLAQSVYKYTGLNHWTDFARTLTATLLEDRVLKASEKIATGKTLTKFETQRLAQIGLGTNELESIAKEVAEHGSVVDGVRTSGSANWRDGNLARIYDAAILKESRANVLQPGAANRVWWMDSELGKTIGQLKTFSIGSGTSYSGAAAAAIGQKQYLHAARFMGFMMIGGYLAHALRQSASGFLPRTDPGDAAREAWSESGMGGILPDILSPVGGMLTRTAAKNGLIEPDNPLGKVFGTADKYQDRNAASAIGGPSIGAFMDLWDVLHQSENGVSASDLHHIRRLLPYQNVWYLRRMINALEGDTADALDLKGASGESTGDRVLVSRELPPE